ncbi:MAG: LapA family protein [Proteobacteria bacterium]|nr:LapA family protein [Pseudomonadota bacterium]
MNVIRFILLAVVFLAILFVSIDNAEQVTLRFFRLAEWQAPLILVVFVAFVLGVVLGMTTGALRTARVRREFNRFKREHHKAAQGPARDTAEAPVPPFDAM